MSFQGPINSSENENMCVVCFKNVEIYSVGICDHPVCFECSTRMRVLCRQKECPMCRQDMPKVIFCYQVEPFRKLKAQQVDEPKLCDSKNGIWFQNHEIKDSYYRLLEHNCKICKNCAPFRNFNQLKEHMRREHELHYCDLCVSNLRIFTWERRCYTRSDLAQHRRKGDVDDTSHRGHPLCEFCDTRYVDSDELFRHLRRTHLYCHICDADGLHHYYPSYDCLREHFKNEHYLCEEGDCINEEFTKVFRTDIDLKAHKALEHGKHLGKAASKQARTLELEFTLAPRPRPEQSAARGGRKPQPSNGIPNEREQDEGAVGYEHTIHTEPGGSRGITLRAQDFPTLGGGAATNVPLSRPPGGNVTIRHIRRGQEGLARTNENFPALSGDSSTVRFSVNSSTVLPQDHQTTSTPNVSIHVNHRPNGAITTHISQNTTTSNSTSSSVRVRPRSTTDAFPALGSVKVPEAAQWVKVSKNTQPKEPKPKISKVAPAPVLPSRDSPTDFPSLSAASNNINTNTHTHTHTHTHHMNNTHTSSSSSIGGGTSNSNQFKFKTEQKEKPKKSSSLTVPVTNSWIQQEQEQQTQTETKSANSKSKKKKPKTSSNNNETQPQKQQSNQIQKNTTSASDNNNKQQNNKNNKKETHTKQNGVVKKRSELKIDSLHISDAGTSNNRNNSENFPSLGGSTNNKPPPGFAIQAPPGFAANDLTFTSSSGESYSILPTHQFSAPPDFQNRNKRLVESFMNTLSTNEAILEFKNLSGMFRNGMYTAEQYYAHCKQVMKSDFTKIFPELLVLLPDIDKQQELYTIHCKNAANKKGLDVCATCRQVLSNNDLRHHLATHALENHFPALGSQEISSVWKK